MLRTGSDADVPLDLQQVFTAVYDRAAYSRPLNYGAELDPGLPPETQEWLKRALVTTR